MNVSDIKGKTFNRLTVISRAESSHKGTARWTCRCVCGNEIVTLGSSLRNGNTKSCGCLRVDVNDKRSTKHGHATNGITPTYHTWAGMKNRCSNKTHKDYKNYGGRGIVFCDEWNDFTNFLFDMGVKPNGKSLDRINNEGDYCKNNCRWATPKEQANNKRKPMLL